MHGGWWLSMAAVAALTTAAAAETPLLERLLAENGRTHTLRCEIRRELEMEGVTLPTLSRIWFERPDRLRVETALPEPRRIVADGTAIYKWIDGQPQGVRIPLAEAPEPELLQLRKTPGTAEEYLLRLKGLPEEPLPPEPGFPVRRAYLPPAPHPYTVLALDETGRLARIEFFDAANRTNRLLLAEFAGWKEAKPGIWLAVLQKTAIRGRDGTVAHETLRVGSLAVNEPIEPEQFEAAKHSGGVRFLSPDQARNAVEK